MKNRIAFLFVVNLHLTINCFAFDDSLQVFINAFKTEMNFKKAKCFNFVSSFKPITLNDTIKRTNLIKVYYPFKTCNDSIFCFIIQGDSTGLLLNNQNLYFYDNKNKEVGEIIMDQSVPQYLSKSRSDILFYTIISNLDFWRLKSMQTQKIIIDQDSIYYLGVNKEKADDSKFIKTIKLIKKPKFKISYQEEFTDIDSNTIQMKEYQIEEATQTECDIMPDSIPTINNPIFTNYKLIKRNIRQSSRKRVIKEGADYIYWSGKDINGKDINASHFKGDYLILDFWYMNCFPCWKAIDELSSLYSQIDTNKVFIVGINPYDKNRMNEASQLFKKKGGNYSIVFDIDKKVIKDYEVFAYPTVFLIDLKENKILLCEEGYKDGLSERLKKMIYNIKD